MRDTELTEAEPLHPTADPPDHGGDPSDAQVVLTTERRHLDRSWDTLRAMRAEAEQVGDVGADELTSWALGALRAERLTALADDPAVASGRAPANRNPPPPLFFGRIDWTDSGHSVHIGRRHVRAEAGGEPLVVDWRAPVSRAFYQATPADPMGVARRRRFGYARGELTSYEDEPLAGSDRSQPAVGSRILHEEIERPRVGPMRDIVATIQPDQDDIVRAGLDQSICVQGAPGTGKTAVGLHRAAYLLYTHPDRLRRTGVLVVGPNRTFLHHIAAVLPALGEVGVTQVTVDELVAGRLSLRGHDDPQVARLKGDPRLAEVLRRATYAGVTRPVDEVVVPVGSHRYRIPPERLRRWVDDLLRGQLGYAAARERLRATIAQEVRRRWEERGGTPTDRQTAAIARSAPVRAALKPAVAGRRPGRVGGVTVVRSAGVDPGRGRSARSGRVCGDRLVEPAAFGPFGPLVAGRRGARRRGGRAAGPAGWVRARGARRGTGPVRDAVPRGGSALSGRVDHRVG